jgi:hypothetical protein
VVLGGVRRVVESTAPESTQSSNSPEDPETRLSVAKWHETTAPAPLGLVIGTRSGDKGRDANLGVFARSDEAWIWLDQFLTNDRLRHLLPETTMRDIQRFRFPKLRALNFVIRGLLGEGVDASNRQDPQAKSLGEWLRARVVDIPAELLKGIET